MKHALLTAAAVVAAAAVAGCGSSSSPDGPAPDDAVGPFTGGAYRFVVDRFTMLRADGQPPIGDDLDGDGDVDNAAGALIDLLDDFHNITTHAADMIASGVLASDIEIIADDFASDDTAGVYYHGARGDQPLPVGGRLTAAGFAPNRTRTTRVPGEAMLRLPVFADADPITVRVVGLQIELTPDGAGGFDGVVAGGIFPSDLREPVVSGLGQMIANDPQSHLVFASFADANRDGVLTREELAGNPLVAPIEHPDLQLFDAGHYRPTPHSPKPDTVSIGFAIHVSPCIAGRCGDEPAADRCHDRAREAAESDVDCGGFCLLCPGGAACLAPTDCQTGACVDGHCREASCKDGIADGLEADVDCGPGCAACARGKRCTVAADCASGDCNGGTCL